MNANSAFPGRSIISAYLATEQSLTRVLNTIPWCKSHYSVWSPRLGAILQESCSQLDSLWRNQAWLSRCVREREHEKRSLDITKYFDYFGKQEPLARRWVIFWGGEQPEQMRPFEEWSQVDKYRPLGWWSDYTEFKHDRIENRERATLFEAVRATAGLFLAILACEPCRYAIEGAGWLTASDYVAYNPKACLGEESPSVGSYYVLVETRLFSYPVGWSTRPVVKEQQWEGNSSMRFKHWFADYCTEQ